MNNNELLKIKGEIHEKIGIVVEGSVGPSAPRKSLSFWFANFNRGNGPVFSIRPSGLKRHAISVKFGPYAAPCIAHIKEAASQEAYSFAYALLEELSKRFDVKLNGKPVDNNWKIDSKFTVEVFRKGLNQSDFESIRNSVEVAMIPLMAAVAELIGYEEEMPGEAEVEGGIKQSVLTRRERSPRNRLLCLSIHGKKCNVCEVNPVSIYGENIGSILEVHHIEPLSEIDEARIYNPRTDLIPLCPNCHRAIHKRKPAYKPEELKSFLKR